MHIIHIQVIQLQILQTLRAGQKDVALSVHIVPYLGDDKQIFSFYFSGRKRIRENLTDLRLVPITGGAVKMAVADLYGSPDGFLHLFRRRVVAAEGSHAHCRHFRACVKRALGNLCRIYFFHCFPPSNL